MKRIYLACLAIVALGWLSMAVAQSNGLDLTDQKDAKGDLYLVDPKFKPEGEKSKVCTGAGPTAMPCASAPGTFCACGDPCPLHFCMFDKAQSCTAANPPDDNKKCVKKKATKSVTGCGYTRTGVHPDPTCPTNSECCYAKTGQPCTTKVQTCKSTG